MAAEHFSIIPYKVYTAHKVQANHIFCNICPCVNNTVSTRFEDLRTFLYVYMRVVYVFVKCINGHLFIYLFIYLFCLMASCAHAFIGQNDSQEIKK